MTYEPTSSTKKQYNEWLFQLEKQHPIKIIEANKLANQIGDPVAATKIDVWNSIWSKPLYANNLQSYGDKKYERIREYFENKLNDIHRNYGDYAISLKEGPEIKDIHWTSNERYIPKGGTINKIHIDNKIAYSQIYQIVSLASWLKEQPDKPLKPFVSGITAQELKDISEKLGLGISHITFLHILTDFGIAVKPDIRLTNTAMQLKIFRAGSRKVNVEEAIQIVERVKKLTELVYPNYKPENLRFVDKVLMEISAQSVVPKILKPKKRKKVQAKFER